MVESKNQAGVHSRHERSGNPVRTQVSWLQLVLHFSLTCLLVGLCWQLIGPEVQTTIEHRVQLLLVALGFVVSAGLWIATSDWLRKFKVAGILTSFLVALVATWQSIQDFDAAGHVLIPGRIEQRRVAHDALRLSYAVLPGFRINLQPIISKGNDLNTTPNPTRRLHYGEAAILCRMLQPPQSQNGGSVPTTLVLEVQPFLYPDTNTFINQVRQSEASALEMPDVQIVQQTHLSRIAGLDMVRFEFVGGPSQQYSRQVFLATGHFLLNFQLNTELESDRRMFDEFLKSIRLE